MADQVFLVEDHPVVRRGLASLLTAEMALTVCGGACTPTAALEKLPEAEPDLVLVDLSLEEGSGLELIKDVKNRWPEMALLVVSMHDETLYALRSLRAGAQGYVMKQRATEVLVDAVRHVLDGRIYVSTEIKEKLIENVHGHNALAKSPLESLSDRELQVFQRLGEGLKTSTIAEELHLSPKTVYSYQSRIKDKLGIEGTPKLRQRAAIWVECCEPDSVGAQA
jgi:DNA-binding NarL/FixJ family response regulator